MNLRFSSLYSSGTVGKLKPYAGYLPETQSKMELELGKARGFTYWQLEALPLSGGLVGT